MCSRLVEYCIFKTPTKGEACPRCNFQLLQDYPSIPLRECPTQCKNLSTPIQRDGITDKVKCTCPNNKNGFTEQWHAAHICNAPEHQRTNGKPGKCLPTFNGPFDEDHQFEAAIYHLCNGPEVCEYFQVSETEP